MTYQYPFRGLYRLGTRYGHKGTMWACGWHSGLDLFSQAAGGDGKIYPIAPGVVLSNKASAAYGNYISIKHEDGYISLYAHMAARSTLAVGAAVNLDTVLGREGSTGNSTAVHLHIEVHKGAYKYPASIDPEAFMQLHMLTVVQAIDNLAQRGVISNRRYWQDRYRDVPELDKLLISMAVHCKVKTVEVTTLQEAAKRLYSAGVIPVLDFWIANAGRIQWLDKLIIAAAEYV